MDKKRHRISDRYLIITLIGFIVLLMGRGIGTKIDLYPSYVQDDGVGPEFQYYTLNTFYGADISDTEDITFNGYRIPVFAIAGYILIMIGLSKLKERSRIFSIGKWMAAIAIGMTVLINMFPFIIHNVNLCYIIICLGIANLGLELSVGYFFVCGLCDVLSGTAFKTDRVTLGITWFVTVACRIVVFVTTWVQLANLTVAYNMILLWTWLFFVYTIWKLRQFVVGEIEFED